RGFELADLEQHLGGREQSLGATVLIAVALVRFAGPREIRTRASVVAQARERPADVGERSGDLKASADREIDADCLEPEGNSVFESTQHEHGERERVLGARL